MINKFLTVLFICLTFSCSAADRNGDDSVKKASKNEEILKEILKVHRSGTRSFSSEEKRLAKDLYNAVEHGTTGYQIERISELISNGADPDYCRGESGWYDSNPLSVIGQSFYSTYTRIYRGEKVVSPTPDILVLDSLLKSGADINFRPYVWERVNLYNERSFSNMKERMKDKNSQMSYNELNEVIKNYMNDCNRLIEAFLEAGADPDMLGHPYPYSREAMEARITDEEAREYFKKGTRAINVAIEKGIAWESQVDLLLKYTTLDEESLKAAERSNDPLMIEKINKLWESK